VPSDKQARFHKGFGRVLLRYYSATTGTNPKETFPEQDVGDEIADQMYDSLQSLESDPDLKTHKGRLSSAYILLNDVANSLDIVACKKRSTKKRPIQPVAIPVLSECTSYDLYVIAVRLWDLTRLLSPQKPGPRPSQSRRRRVGRPRKWDLDDRSRTLLLTILQRFRAAIAAQGIRPTNVRAIEAYLRADDLALPPSERYPSATALRKAARTFAKRLSDIRRPLRK